MRIQLLQDIHLQNVSIWELVREQWKKGKYASFIEILETNDALVDKIANADWFNSVTSLLYTVEHFSDPTFKDNKIIASDTPPVLNEGEVYFETEAEPESEDEPDEESETET